MKSPFFSLIVPAYNEEKYIKNTLISLKNQSFDNFEIIVIDNNCTDNTVKIAKSFGVKIFKEKKRGILPALKLGFAKARGEFMMESSSDTIYPIDYLKKIKAHIDKNSKIAGVYGSAMLLEYPIFLNIITYGIFTSFMAFSKLIGHDNTPGFNFMMKKSAYFKVGGYDELHYNSIGLDLELGLRISKIGKLIFDPFLIVKTSARRETKNGFIRTHFQNLTAWFNLHFKLPQSVSQEIYTKEKP